MTQNIKPMFLEDIRPKTDIRVSILSKLSHELKTPIHGISGISSYLSDNWNDLSDSDKKKYLSFIVEATSNLTSLLNSILNNSGNKDEIEFLIVKCSYLYAKNSIDEKKEERLKIVFSEYAEYVKNNKSSNKWYDEAAKFNKKAQEELSKHQKIHKIQ